MSCDSLLLHIVADNFIIPSQMLSIRMPRVNVLDFRSSTFPKDKLCLHILLGDFPKNAPLLELFYRCPCF